MKQKIKKLFSALILSTLIVNNSYALSIAPTYEYSNTKIQKLSKLNIQLANYINKDLKQSIIWIKNVDAKKSFNSELSNINTNIKNLSTTLSYSSDTEFKNKLEELKFLAQKYKKLKNELNNYTKTWINVFKIEDWDKTNIEKDIINMQSYYLDIIKESLNNIDFSKDIKQTWDWKFEISSNIWKITINIEKFVSVLSILTWNQEVDYGVTIAFDIKKDTTLNIPYDISWSTNFQLNLKVVDKEMYLTLKDFSFDTSKITDKDLLKSIDEGMKMFDSYKWKTIHIPAQNWTSWLKFDTTAQIANLKSVLDILTKESLLSPYKKEWEWFLLTVNKNTITKLAKIYWQEISDSDFTSMKASLSNYPILYSSNNWSPKITSSKNTSTEKYSFSIEKKWEDYALEYKLNSNSLYSKIDLYVFLQKWIYKVNFVSDSFTMDFSLEKEIFDFLIQTEQVKATMKWTYNNNNCDLVISVNWIDIGTIKSTKDDKENYTYELYIKIDDFTKIYQDIPETFKDKFLEIKISWKTSIERWEFKIEKPTTYIELDELNKSKEDYKTWWY